MPLYEYQCQSCKKIREVSTSVENPDAGECPHCHSHESKRVVSRFWMGGQGDLRESTMHGCHDHFTGVESADGHIHTGSCKH